MIKMAYEDEFRTDGFENEHTETSDEFVGNEEFSFLEETKEFDERFFHSDEYNKEFCGGLKEEGRIACEIFRAHGFTVVSAICKAGGVPKEQVGLGEEDKVHPGRFEPMCNPIAQAMLLNEQQTEFNIVIGLCVGHDSLFYKYAQAPTTTLVTKDRALAHNPAGALYCAHSYFKDKV